MFVGFDIYGSISMMLSFLGFSILIFGMIDNEVLRNEMTYATLEKAKNNNRASRKSHKRGGIWK